MSEIAPDIDRSLAKQVAAAKALREALATITDDEAAIRDTIEGETSLHEQIAVAMAALREDEIMVAGLAEMIGTLDTRKARFEHRIERRRAAVEQAMSIGEITTLPLPDATLSLRKVPPGLEITDEAKIPAKFWKPRDPTLDKKALKDALTDGEAVEGATLGNGGLTLSIRRK